MAVKKATVKKTVKKAPATTVENTAAVAKTQKKGSLSVNALDLTGKVVESVSLPTELFGAKINKTLMAQAVRVSLANQRQGNASTKSRGEVRGSTRKIYRQKGTGRARHGGVRAPIFVHGGVAHGPKPHDFSLSMPQKMRQKALFSALSAKVKDNNITVLTGFETMEPKTKHFAAFLKAADLQSKKSVLVVLPKKEENVVKAVRNIDGVSYLLATQLNTYDILTSNTVLVLKDALSVMEKHFIKEGKNA